MPRRWCERLGVCVVVALAAVWLLGGSALAAEPEPAYIRISVSPKATVYVEFRDKEMRVAGSVEGLKDAKPVKATGGRGAVTNFPEVRLPVASEALPGKGGALKATLMVYRQPSRARRRGLLGRMTAARQATVQGNLGLCLTDEKKTEWVYSWSASSQLGKAPDKAPLIQVADIKGLTLEVVAKPDGRRKNVGIGVRLKSGKLQLSDVLKAGKSAEVSVRLVDSDGKEVASAKGPLSKFGFA